MWTTLGEIADWSSGGTPRRTEESYYGGDIPWAVIGDLNDEVVTQCKGSITHEGLSNSSCKIVRPGTILIAMYGSIGKLGIAGMPMATNQAIASAVPRISSQYLFYFLLAQRSQLAEAGKGATQRNISQTILKAWPIPVAPPMEQDRIVAVIEEHFSRLDAVQSTLEGGLRSVAGFRRSLLTGAFKVNGTLPHNWQRAEIGEVAKVQLGRQRSPEHHAGPQMRPYLRAANVTWAGLSLDDVKQMNFDEGDFETYRLRPGDLLLNEASGSPNEVGKPAVWNGEIENCCFQNTLLRLQARDVNPGYLYWYCYMAASTGLFGEAGRGVNIRHLGKQGLARFPIPVAPKFEQERIVTRLEEQFHQLSGCEASIHQALERLHALRRSILTRAFNGQLVPQSPDNEPATALLERIAKLKPA